MEARKQRMKEIRRLLDKNEAAASALLNETRKKFETESSQEDSVKSNDGSSNYNSTDSSTTTHICSEPTPRISSEDGMEEELTQKHNDRTKRDIEETFRSAEINLQNLTMLRERLEEMQVRGEDLTEEDVSLISQLEGENQMNEQSKDEERETA
ncbi:hypothetical protein KIN20_006855 [Parelaphostrongylus tenuis]|uniref:Uncharacterized protein n=1 Tax=Parelaphostrongylus tenuis TaxID=148309 RepID=A0AAD5MKP9_PARTN|nr:hypothetical protein KIN20_006855 [Parelaphostrongylus tenuis]